MSCKSFWKIFNGFFLLGKFIDLQKQLKKAFVGDGKCRSLMSERNKSTKKIIENDGNFTCFKFLFRLLTSSHDFITCFHKTLNKNFFQYKIQPRTILDFQMILIHPRCIDDVIKKSEKIVWETLNIERDFSTRSVHSLAFYSKNFLLSIIIFSAFHSDACQWVRLDILLTERGSGHSNDFQSETLKF